MQTAPAPTLRRRVADAHLNPVRGGAERLREPVARKPCYAGPCAPIDITVSVGLTEYIAGESVGAAIERADRALYDAKAQGRNRSVVA